MKLLPFLSLAAAGLGLVLAGCSTPPKISGITVSVMDFHVPDPADPSAKPVMTLQFASESVNPAGFTRSTYKLYFNNLYVGKAVSETPVGVPAMGTVTLNVPLQIEDLKAVGASVSVSGESVPYRLECVLYYADGEHTAWIKPVHEGTVSARGLESLVH